MPDASVNGRSAWKKMAVKGNKRRFRFNRFGKNLPATSTLFPAVELFAQLFVEPGHTASGRFLRQRHEVRFVEFVQHRAILHIPDQFDTLRSGGCLLYTSDAADDLLCVDLGGRRIIKKKN